MDIISNLEPILVNRNSPSYSCSAQYLTVEIKQANQYIQANLVAIGLVDYKVTLETAEFPLQDETYEITVTIPSNLK